MESLQNPQVEKAALSCLLHAELPQQKEMLCVFKSGHFQSARLTIFEAVATLVGSGRQADISGVVGELESRSVLDGIGGIPAIGEIASQCQGAAGWKSYHKTLEELRYRRKVVEVGDEMIHRAKEGAIPVSELKQWAEAAPMDIDFDMGEGEGKSMKFAVSEAITRAENIVSGKEQAGISTGINGLDRFWVGMRKGELIVVAARPSVGKTALGMQIARNAATNGARVLIYSLEMKASQLTARFIYGDSGVTEHQLRNKAVTQEGLTKMLRSGNIISELPITVYDKPGVSMNYITSTARREMLMAPVDLIVIDYLGLIHGTSKRAKEDKVQEIGENVLACKELARTIDCPMVLLAQVNRDPERRSGGRPKLSDLKGSGEIEQTADKVCLMWRDEENEEEESPTQIVFADTAKHRDGPTGKCELEFHKQKTRFVDSTPFG